MLKPSSRAWIARAIVITGYSALIASLFAATHDEQHWWWILLAAAPLYVSAFLLTIHLYAFPFPYSVFSSRQRRPAPEEPVLATSPRTSGHMGFFAAGRPFFTWVLYPSGIFVSVPYYGAAFVPFTRITRLQRRVFTLSGGVAVHHTCPEVRSPLQVPAGAVATRLDAWQQKGKPLPFE